jgi:hypothetical protein
MSVIWLAAIFGHLQRLSERRRRQLQHTEMLARQLDHSIIEQMDRDGLGVDKVEFVVETLMHLGAEIGGEPLSWAHVEPILKDAPTSLTARSRVSATASRRRSPAAFQQQPLFALELALISVVHAKTGP